MLQIMNKNLYQPKFLMPLSAQTASQVELAWEMACSSLEANDNQVIIPGPVYARIGRDGLESIKLRLSAILGNSPVVALIDHESQVIRVMKQPLSLQPTAEARADLPSRVDNGASAGIHLHKTPRAFGKKAKTPRPPNAFILYRQHFHPHYKQSNPTMHNNEISKALGTRWKAETDEVRERYRQLSAEMKKRHSKEYPDYQYAPRKPGEKKRRMTARKMNRIRAGHDIQETSQFPSLGSNACSETVQSQSAGAHHQLSTPDDNTTTGSRSSRTGSPEITNLSFMQLMNDTTATIIPNSHDNINAEIAAEFGEYGLDYHDIMHENHHTDLSVEQRLLQGTPDENVQDQQALWSSLIDWQGLTEDIGIIEHLSSDEADVLALRSTQPERASISDAERVSIMQELSDSIYMGK